MSPESVVRSWWNGLPLGERIRIGRLQYADPLDSESDRFWADYWDWALEWDRLTPVGQQMRLHMWFDQQRSRH